MYIKNNIIYYVNEYDDLDSLYGFDMFFRKSKRLIDDDIKLYDVSDNYIYYVPMFKLGCKKCLYRTNLNGDEKTLVVDDNIKWFDLHDIYIFYAQHNPDGTEPLYRVQLDNFNRIKLFDDIPFYYNFQDDWIYYGDSNEGSIRKKKYDGSEDELVSNETSVISLIRDGWLYYQDEDNNSLYRMRLDGTGIIRLTTESVEDFVLYQDTIIYQGKHDMYEDWWKLKLYKVNIEGTNKKLIYDKILKSMKLYKDFIYFIIPNESGSGDIARIDIDGKRFLLLEENNVYLNDVLDGYIYYELIGNHVENKFFEYHLIRSKYDGTQNEHIMTMIRSIDV